MTAIAARSTVLTWLLDADPSIRWQVMRDLVHESPEIVAAERQRVATEGWGNRLLRMQSPRGDWADPKEPGPWMATIYVLATLRDLGLDPASDRARLAIELIQQNLVWKPLGDRPFFDGETEPCINGAILTAGAYFGVKCDRLLALLLNEQLEDGGWNCDAPTSKRSSFHTTIRVLEGLLEHEKSFGASSDVTNARLRAQEYLLERHLFRSRRTGAIIDREWFNYAFPPTWRYDILRGLDYLRSAGVKPDERVDEAVEQMLSRMHRNGLWPRNVQHEELLPFALEGRVGTASRWITLRALRVYLWYLEGQ
jgi:hypothetical protein